MAVANEVELEILHRLPGRAVLVMPRKYLEIALKDGMDVPYEVVWEEKAWTPERNKWVDYLVIEKR